MWDFNLSIGLVILGGLAFSILNWFKQMSCRTLLVAGLALVTGGACLGCGPFFWPRPALPRVGWPAGTLACLVEAVTDGRSSRLVWGVEPSPSGQRFAVWWELNCPRSKLMAVDRKG
jgi:hypothetical protein